MNLESIRIALGGLRADKLRSALTMLGILIGVASVIVLVAVGTGSKAAVAKQFESLGSNTITVINGGGGFGSRNGTQTRQVEIRDADVKALTKEQNCPHCKEIVPSIEAQDATGSYQGNKVSPGGFTGTAANFSTVRSFPLKSGTFFTDADVTNRRKVVVLGQTVADKLFGTGARPSSIIGEQVLFGSAKWTVIGIFEKKGTNGFEDQDDTVVAPYTAVKDTLAGGAAYTQLTVEATSKDTTAAAQSEITSTLNALHQTTASESPFLVLNQVSLQSSQEQSSNTLTVLLGIVSAISLLVGGIGVMNIMLVTVTERTREIGIRRAIGAQKNHILTQFVVEAVMLSMIGGILGIAAGLLGSQFEIADVDPVVEPYSIALAFGVALLTGLFFGLYPAYRAATLRPIDALRYE